jgi:hypothetical protein
MPIYQAVATGNRNNELYRETARSNWKKTSIATMPGLQPSKCLHPDPSYFSLPSTVPLKILSSEMDPAETRFIQKVFRRGDFLKISPSPILSEPFKDSPPSREAVGY